MARPPETYSEVGEMLFRVLSGPVSLPQWKTVNHSGVMVGPLGIRLKTSTWSRRSYIYVYSLKTSRTTDDRWSASLTPDDHARLVPLLFNKRGQVENLEAAAEQTRVMSEFNESLPTDLPPEVVTQQKLTADAVIIAERVLEAARKGTVSRTDLMALIDKVREDLDE